MDLIGRYQVVAEIGRGGEGVVYSALDPEIGRMVAIKTLPDSTGFDPSGDFASRLKQEAKSAGRLSHPNIVTVHELVTENGRSYIVMELVEGKTLDKLIKDGSAKDPELLSKVVTQAADALDYAHGQGVVHRDIKPENLMLHQRGHVKVADFGIAKVLNDSVGPRTQTGMLRGTAYYMSPEQIGNETLTGRSDQFSLAVVVYECLAGVRPFQADSAAALLYQILRAEPPGFGTGDTTFSPAVKTVLRKAMAKDPKARYETCSAFGRALEQALHAKAAVAVAPVVNRRFPVRAVSLVLAGLCLAALSWSVWNRPAPAPQSTAVPPAAAAALPKPADPGPAKPVAAAPAPAKPEKTLPKPPAQTRTVTPQPEPKPAAAAAVIEPPTVSAEPPPPPPGRYFGPPEGQFAWSGSLAPGQSLTIAGQRSGTGKVEGRGLPPGVALAVTVDPPAVHVEQEPGPSNRYQLVVRNTGSTALPRLTVRWSEKK